MKYLQLNGTGEFDAVLTINLSVYDTKILGTDVEDDEVARMKQAEIIASIEELVMSVDERMEGFVVAKSHEDQVPEFTYDSIDDELQVCFECRVYCSLDEVIDETEF